MKDIKIHTELLHPSQIAGGEFILEVNNMFYGFCGGIMITNSGFYDSETCILAMQKSSLKHTLCKSCGGSGIEKDKP